MNGTAVLKTETATEKGSATELAILKLLKKSGLNYQDIRDKFPNPQRYPFNSERKRMSTIIEHEGKKIILLKGASEIVLSCCDKWMECSNGAICPLDA